jgi:hypothetical protein
MTRNVESLTTHHAMVYFNPDGTPDLGLVHLVRPDQTVDFLARFPVDSGEWRAVPAMDATDIDYTKDWGQA